MKLIAILSIILSLSANSFASMHSAHSSDDDNKSSDKMTYTTPCEISGIILMAESEEICTNLKEKISSHDHD